MGEGTEDTAVVREVSLDADREEVWSALTEPDRLSAWLGGRVEVEVRPGGRGTVTRDDGASRRLVVEAVDPGRRLAFRWWPFEEGRRGVQGVVQGGGPGRVPGPSSRVEFLVESLADRTVLTVREAPPMIRRPDAAAAADLDASPVAIAFLARPPADLSELQAVAR